MSKPLKILFVTTDLPPFSKAGGLGDVSRSLPKALSKMGHDVKIIMPCHGVINEEKNNIKLIKEDLKVKIYNENKINFRIKKGILDQKLPVYFVDKYKYFGGRSKVYGYDDENQRFLFFCFAVFEVIKNMEDSWVPDIIHCNDWHTGMIPYLLKTKFSKKDIFKKTRTLFTIHNLTFQMGKDWWTIDKRNQDDGMSKIDDFKNKEKIDLINFAKRGIICADIVNTVSEQYAQEIMQKKFGQELHDILQIKCGENKFYGIINGIDYKEYNPKTDPGLKINYDENSLEKKIINKKQLQKNFKLEIDEDIPVIAMATRVTEQKGFDLILEIADALARLKMQLIIVGSADPCYRKKFRMLSKKHSKKFAVHLKFETKKITGVYAGSDMFLMPSRFEPCGLGQMISLRYGSIPIVRETGGLSDTITNYNPRIGKGNGFVFKTYDPKDLLVAITRALENYKYKKEWQNIVKNGMQKSFSWEVPAKKYVLLYKKALNFKREKKFMYRTIEDINQKIKVLASEQGFKITKTVNSFVKKEKRYYAYSVLKGDIKIFLKARIADDNSSVYGLEKEMEITRIMTENDEMKKKVNFTKYLDGSLTKIPEWYTHGYIEGDLLGDFYDMPRKHNQDIYINNVVENLLNLQSVSKIFIKEAEKNGVIKYIKKRGYEDYKNTIKYYQKEEIGKGKIDFFASSELIEKNRKLLDENLVVAHGDFTMANHIIAESGKAYLSDWESVRIDNIAADLAHLWVQTWRYKKWRGKLLAEFLNRLPESEKESFKEIFRIVAIEQSMAEIKWNSASCKKEYKKGVIDISTQIIKTALDGFDGLLEI
ncbi:MAG: glycogen/starch synthase [Candidatus Pacebacteria bacterium]|nr:glycogen/starch synthase [Candidatus Paceibacterota bacterium]